MVSLFFQILSDCYRHQRDRYACIDSNSKYPEWPITVDVDMLIPRQLCRFAVADLEPVPTSRCLLFFVFGNVEGGN